MKLVCNEEQIFSNMEGFEAQLEQKLELANRLGFVRAWYIDARRPEKLIFSFSKYIGYADINAKIYLEKYKELNGRDTEHVLANYCEELSTKSPQYHQYFEALSEWLAKYDKTPRKDVRLNILKATTTVSQNEKDQRLMELLYAVAELLPDEQRFELRSRL